MHEVMPKQRPGEQVVTGQNLTASRHPGDLPATFRRSAPRS
jgi:hypothetical protein